MILTQVNNNKTQCYKKYSVYSEIVQGINETFDFKDDVCKCWGVHKVLFHEAAHLVAEASTHTHAQKFLVVVAQIRADSFQVFTSETSWDINKIRSIIAGEGIHVAYHTYIVKIQVLL